MGQLQDIKLIIWDLDDTFWKGTLSEERITPIPNNIKLVKDLTDRGIINAICSKNDKEPVELKLKEFEVAEYFVFNSIDWTPKGPRIEALIKNMGLRATNVLFIDDNVVNLNEAKHYSPELKICEPAIINDIIAECKEIEPKDCAHKRLKQYKVLELKQKAKDAAADNQAFLYSTNTQVQIHKDCEAALDRITELVNRTNQLNYTKLRSTREELYELIKKDSVDSGYVTVKDNFGDYGIVGFYAIENHKFIHFLFSCRTIGQGVEQYVYSVLNWPELITIGKVVNNVEKIDAPEWINRESDNSALETTKNNHKIVIKGACDLNIMTSFLSSNNIITEFTYIGQLRKNDIEHHNHSINYLTLPFLPPEEQDRLVEELIFCDSEMFKTHMYDPDVDMVFVSSLIEANLGIYKNKATGIEIAFAEHYHSLTDPEMWNKYIGQEINNYGNSFTLEWFEQFSKNWEFVGKMTPERYIEQLKKVLSKISPNACLCIMLGSEMPYLKNTDKTYEGRHLEHKIFNDKLREFAEENSRIKLLDLNSVLKNQSDFTNNINHFHRRVYFDIAKMANDLIYEITGSQIKHKGVTFLYLSILKTQLYKIKIFNTNLLDISINILHFIKKIKS